MRGCRESLLHGREEEVGRLDEGTLEATDSVAVGALGAFCEEEERVDILRVVIDAMDLAFSGGREGDF